IFTRWPDGPDDEVGLRFAGKRHEAPLCLRGRGDVRQRRRFRLIGIAPPLKRMPHNVDRFIGSDRPDHRHDHAAWAKVSPVKVADVVDGDLWHGIERATNAAVVGMVWRVEWLVKSAIGAVSRVLLPDLQAGDDLAAQSLDLGRGK